MRSFAGWRSAARGGPCLAALGGWGGGGRRVAWAGWIMAGLIPPYLASIFYGAGIANIFQQLAENI